MLKLKSFYRYLSTRKAQSSTLADLAGALFEQNKGARGTRGVCSLFFLPPPRAGRTIEARAKARNEMCAFKRQKWTLINNAARRPQGMAEAGGFGANGRMDCTRQRVACARSSSSSSLAACYLKYVCAVRMVRECTMRIVCASVYLCGGGG